MCFKLMLFVLVCEISLSYEYKPESIKDFAASTAISILGGAVAINVDFFGPLKTCLWFKSPLYRFPSMHKLVLPYFAAAVVSRL